ncbi:RND family efflux transporter MFP subunit [Rhodopseudomonas faecalis]|uniref:RND family efflux transporter MFP subunit n=2 Tax=Rhodopseudomonas faecalis TaxID=99655 RepID=A0A318TTB8_9BRAD|nr:RND family efflux transporter MFP subunit [Rhodopseudomonas faecalis]
MRHRMTFGLTAMMMVAATSAQAESVTVAQRSVADEKAVFATVESTSVVPARSRIGGTIIDLDVREGDAVTQGQRIATVADDKLALQLKSLDAQIRALQAQASQAQIDFTRVEGLVERGTLPRVKLDEVRTALNVAENGLRAKTAERAVIQQQTEEGQVLAPAAGRVLRRQAVAGSVVLPGDPVVMIAQQDFKLRLRVPERHARFLKAGDGIRIDGEAFADGKMRTGTVDLVYPQIEDGRVIADARFDNPREYFVGDRLRVWISGGDRTSFVVPASYVLTRFGIDYVQLKRNGTIANVPVQRGRPLPSAEQPDGIEILSGVRAGDELVRP